MQITSANQLFQHIDTGGHLSVNKEGQLQSQSGISHFFQKIGDAFQKLSASGRAHIESRQNAIYDAMARLVADNTQVNPAGDLIPEGPVSATQRSAMQIRLEAAHIFKESKLPQELQGTFCNYMAKAMPKLLAENPQTNTATEVFKACKSFADNPELLKALNKNVYEMTPQIRTEILRDFKADLQKTLSTPSMLGKFLPSGVHDCYAKDAIRHAIASINGHPPLEGVALDKMGAAEKAELYNKELSDFLAGKDTRIVKFVSAALQQGGMPASALSLTLGGKLGNCPGGSIMADGIIPGVDSAINSVKIENNIIKINMDIHAGLKVTHVNHESITPFNLQSAQLTVDLQVDLNQELGDKPFPDFTITDAGFHDVQILE